MKCKTVILFLCFAAAATAAYAQAAQGVQNPVQKFLDGISYWRFQYNAEDTSFGHEVVAADSIYAMNDSLMNYLLNIAPQQPGILKRKPVLSENADINIVTTEDKKLSIYCWNSHTGKVDFYNAVVLYETAEGVKAMKIANASDAKEMQKASGQFYNVLEVNSDKGENCFIFLARVKISEKDMLNIMTSYILADNQLRTVELFSGGNSSGKFITYMYDYMANYDFEKMKEINTVHLSKNGKKLYIPVVNNNQMTGEWQVYTFDGSKFVYDKIEK